MTYIQLIQPLSK